MDFQVISDKIELASKRDVLHLHLYTKFMQKKIRATETELNVLMELYDFGGFEGEEKEKEFFKRCISMGYRKSINSVRNVLAKYTKNGVLNKNKKHQRSIKETFLPTISSPAVGLDYKVFNASR